MKKQNNISTSKDNDSNDLLRRNLKMNEEMHEMLKDVKRYILWRRIWTAIKIFVIVIPLILGVIYLPPLVKDWVNRSQGFFNIGSNLNTQKTLGQEVQDWDKQELQEVIDKMTPDQKEWIKEMSE